VSLRTSLSAVTLSERRAAMLALPTHEREVAMSTVQIVRLRAAEGKADELRGIIEQARSFSLTVDGCEAFDVYEAAETPGSIVMVERWASVEQHQQHFQKNVIDTGVLDRVGALLSAPMEYGYHKQL
jgi:quinol monooxygenase YgiN